MPVLVAGDYHDLNDTNVRRDQFAVMDAFSLREVLTDGRMDFEGLNSGEDRPGYDLCTELVNAGVLVHHEDEAYYPGPNWVEFMQMLNNACGDEDCETGMLVTREWLERPKALS